MLQALLKAAISMKASDFKKKMKRRTNEAMNVMCFTTVVWQATELACTRDITPVEGVRMLYAKCINTQSLKFKPPSFIINTLIPPLVQYIYRCMHAFWTFQQKN